MEKVLVAVSGGPDSMYLLNKIYNSKDYDPIAVHVNYHLRESSNRDQLIVDRFCESKDIPLFILDVKKEDWSAAPVKNEEAAARYLRYEFFLEIAKEQQAKTLLVGHHLDDWIETAIMMEDKSDKYLYYGIKPESNYKELKILRPLISSGLYKEDILNYLKEEQVPYGIDETNVNTKYTRNKVRANLLLTPKKSKAKIIKHYQKINKSQLKTATIIANLYTDWETADFSWDFYNSVNEKYTIDLIYYFLLRQNEFININKNKISAVEEFLASPAEGRKYRLMEGVDLSINKGKIRVSYEKSNNRQ